MFLTSTTPIVVHTVGPAADLAITKADGVSSVIQGQGLTYTITATNAGPGSATGATVTDNFPAALTSCTWTCAASVGASCTASGNGNIGDTITLPSAATVTYTANCTVAASFSGALQNTATVAPAAGLTDPVAGNNSATDTDTVLTTGIFNNGFE